MQQPRKLKEILADVAKTFDVTKGRVWDTVKRSVKGFGHGWMDRLYVERVVTAEEAKEYNLPPTSVALSFNGDTKPCIAVYPSTYKDKDQVERTTVCAASFEYLRSVGMKEIKPSDWEPEDDVLDLEQDSAEP